MIFSEDKLSKAGIEKYLKESHKFNISLFDEVSSTNALLKKQVKTANEGRIIIADSQTDGRGRFERKFFSPKGCGIYMSILLKPLLEPQKSVLITAAAAAAVAKAAEKLSGKKTEIKWVNDVLVDNLKVCGILTEGAINSSGNFDWAILGIGINAYTPENGFDSKIKGIAGAVFDEHKADLRNQLCAEIINIFTEFYSDLENLTFFDEYNSRMAVKDKEIDVIKGENIIPARALSIDENCRLLVEYKNGEREYLSSGEISIKLKKDEL